MDERKQIMTMWEDLRCHLIEPTWQDKVDADIAGISLKQHMFNTWMSNVDKTPDSFEYVAECRRVKLSWWKCAFWWMIPKFILNIDDAIKFRGWSIGHCLNCDANPYDGTVYAWAYDSHWHRGALIKCNKCGQFRWQEGECGTDY